MCSKIIKEIINNRRFNNKNINNNKKIIIHPKTMFINFNKINIFDSSRTRKMKISIQSISC